MDFGYAVGVEGLVGSDPDVKDKPYGSGFFKQLERPSSEDAADDWRVTDDRGGSPKMAKLGDDQGFSVSAPKAAAMQQRISGNASFSNAQQSQHMLCFSTSSALHNQKSETQSPALPYLSSYSPSVYSNYAGLSSGNNVQGILVGGGRGPFTPSQWMELEHQAMIYKCITANVPVPANLLIPIKKAFESAGLYYSSKLLRPNSLGWGGFQLGFSHSTDPEPGRCRRTDGKKWRCSKDAVADQKYCERHMNRGRHRSRKPVEGLNSGHPVSMEATATEIPAATAPSTGTPNKQGLSFSSLLPRSGTTYNSFNNLQFGVLPLSTDPSLNRLYMNKETNNKMESPSPCFSYKSKAAPFPADSSPFAPSPSPLFNTCQNLGTLKDLTDQEAQLNHSMCQFMNHYSSDATDLSISVTMGSKDDNKITLSPLRSAHEQDHVHMNLGVGGSIAYNEKQQQAQALNWIPISWGSGSSMGGPLGEVLHNANSTNNTSANDCKNSSILNLMTGGWESSSSSSPLRSSPTGVLQRTAFGCVSNNSAASSPHAEDSQPKLPEEI
ncbi:hypothetical protein SAY87_004945 [Trapa incisa]|uniref:Growth-regulating factor n=1 Tax=Trapa incisa TaxID=236973 RepID=A0AAN7JVH7_9MYRT|nr:hypothetical protein SAY87_004945 [Trapa incisa]